MENNKHFTFEELLGKFKNGQELYEKSALFNRVVRTLAAGQSPYELLEEVIVIADAIQENFTEYAKSDTRNLSITVSKESYNRLLQEVPAPTDLP